MKTLRGNQLNAEDRKHVLAAYVYRGTIENQRANPEAVKRTGSRLPLITDEQWLAITEWPITQAGRIDQRAKHCTTWHSEIPSHAKMLGITKGVAR